jgi:ribosomal protein S18 acetylase RimI-like enzyme
VSGAPADRLVIRPLTAVDLPVAASLAAAAFGFSLTTPGDAERWRDRVAHATRTDPDGCFVAERDGRLIGIAQAIVRERLWVLSLLTVDPAGQSRGAGRALLHRALAYGAPDAPGLIVSSSDPRALALYALAGFTLHPTFEARGVVDPRRLPALGGGVSEANIPDLDVLAAVSSAVRGGPHTPDLRYALRRGARLLRLGDRGFAVVQPGDGIWLLVARDEAAGSALLAHALALLADAPDCRVRWVLGSQDWAVQMLVRAGLRLSSHGALAMRGDPGPLRAYIPSAAFA